MHLPSAYAEEASILENATVSDDNMEQEEGGVPWPGSNLIGKGFKSGVKFSGSNPLGDNSAQFQIILSKPASIKTAMIINTSRDTFLENRYYMGSAEMWVGDENKGVLEATQKVASGIVDGGFQEFEPLTRGEVVTFRRPGMNPVIRFSWLHLNEIRLYETVNLLKE